MRKRADVLGDVVWRCGMGDEERRRERERWWQCGPAMRREERDMGDEAILLPCLRSPLFYVGGFLYFWVCSLLFLRKVFQISLFYERFFRKTSFDCFMKVFQNKLYEIRFTEDCFVMCFSV